MDMCSFKELNEFATSQGIALAMSILLNAFLVRLYFSERKDRREAFKKYNNHLEGQNPIILGNTLAIENMNRISSENTRALEGVKCKYFTKD